MREQKEELDERGIAKKKARLGRVHRTRTPQAQRADVATKLHGKGRGGRLQKEHYGILSFRATTDMKGKRLPRGKKQEKRSSFQ